MFDADFDTGFEMDDSYLDNEDFGMAKSFTNAPMGLISPYTNLKKAEEPDVEKNYDVTL